MTTGSKLDPPETPVEPDADPAPAPESNGSSSPLARFAVPILIVLALAALFWPKGDGRWDAPGCYLVDDAGRPAPLGERMAPVTLLHFWATWCPPCLTETPAILRLEEALESEVDFRMLMVAVADDLEQVKTFLGEQSGRVLYDHGWEVTHRYGTEALPETYLIANGEVVHHYVGPQNWDDPDIRQPIHEALAEVRQ